MGNYFNSQFFLTMLINDFTHFYHVKGERLSVLTPERAKLLLYY